MAITLTNANVMAQKLETAYIELISGNVSSYSIGGTSFTRLDIDKLFTQMTYWRSKSDSEQYGSNVYMDQRTTTGSGNG